MAFYPFPQEVKQKKTYRQIMREKNGNSDYIFWQGGDCPVHDAALIEVVYRCGDTKICVAGSHESNDWRMGDGVEPFSEMDIIAYREIKRKNE